MIPKQFQDIDASDILALVSDQVREGKTLDYKEALPGRSDRDKREFLADVSSFANASGGDIIYGLVDKRGAQGKPTGVPQSARGLVGINADQEMLRLQEIVRNGIEPRVPGIQLRAIDGFPQGPIIVLRVPQSWAAPHMVTFNNLSRFFARTSAGKYQLDVGEIRASFLLSESQQNRMRHFREDRLGKIMADETPVPVRA